MPAKKNCTVLTADTLTGEYPGNRPAQKSLYPRMTLWKMVKKTMKERKENNHETITLMQSQYTVYEPFKHVSGSAFYLVFG